MAVAKRGFDQSWLQPETLVVVKQEPNDYLPEDGDMEEEDDENHVRARGGDADPEFNPSSDPNHSNESDTEFGPEVNLRHSRRSKVAGKRKGVKASTTSSSRLSRHPRGRPRGSKKAKAAKKVVDPHESNRRPRPVEDSDSSDGEIADVSAPVKMTRLLYPSQLSHAEVDRARHSFVVLEKLPEEVCSRGMGATFSAEELKTLIKSQSRTINGNPVSAPNALLQIPRLGPTTSTTILKGKEMACPYNPLAPLKPHQCETCGKQFRKPSELVLHNQIHTGVMLFPCRTLGCNRQYTGSSGRQKHEANCTSSAPVEGDGVYGVVVEGDKIKLQRPIGVSKAKPNPSLVEVARIWPIMKCKVCRYCHKTFSNPGVCRRHEWRHADIKPYKCAYEGCTEKFRTSDRLKEHVRIAHTGEKPFKCTYEGCGMEFAAQMNFRHHIRVKHIQARFPCSICGRSFLSKQYRDIHEAGHNNTEDGTSFLCPDCGKTYKTRYHLSKHNRNVHLYPKNKGKRRRKPTLDPSGNSIQHNCTFPGCNFTFFHRASLYRHVKSVHKERMRNFTPREDRPYPCTYAGCKFSFSHKYNLTAHIKNHHENEGAGTGTSVRKSGKALAVDLNSIGSSNPTLVPVVQSQLEYQQNYGHNQVNFGHQGGLSSYWSNR